jgi:hypothetical protein
MSNVDLNQIEKDVIALATNSFKRFAKQGVADGKTFLNQFQAQIITLAQDHARKEITDAEYEDGLRDLKALARMEAIKQAGLAQVAIDNFTNGIVDIVSKAALAAIPI